MPVSVLQCVEQNREGKRGGAGWERGGGGGGGSSVVIGPWCMRNYGPCMDAISRCSHNFIGIDRRG